MRRGTSFETTARDDAGGVAAFDEAFAFLKPGEWRQACLPARAHECVRVCRACARACACLRVPARGECVLGGGWGGGGEEESVRVSVRARAHTRAWASCSVEES